MVFRHQDSNPLILTIQIPFNNHHKFFLIYYFLLNKLPIFITLNYDKPCIKSTIDRLLITSSHLYEVINEVLISSTCLTSPGLDH